MKPSSDLRSRLMLLSSMVIFGTIGLFRRWIPLSSAALAMVRGLIGTLFLLLILWLRRQKIDFHALKANALPLILSGAFIGFNWILLFEAYNYTTVAVATLCYYMEPILVVLCAAVLLKETLTLRKGLCAAAAFAGMLLVSGVLSSSGGSIRGILLGLGAAVLYTAVVLLNKKISGVQAYDRTIVQLFLAGIVLVPYVLLTGQPGSSAPDARAIALTLVVGLVHTGLAYTLYFASMAELPAQVVALYSYLDPIVAVLLSALVLHEHMGILEIIGSVLVLGATFVSELPEIKKNIS